MRYRDLAKTGLFPTTERVLPPIPDNTDNGLPGIGVQKPMTPPPGPFSGTVIALNLYQNPLECAALNEIDDPPPPYGPKETSKLGSFLRIF